MFIAKQIGSAIVVDVIKFDPVSMEAIVRVKERYVINVCCVLELKSFLPHAGITNIVLTYSWPFS